MGSSIIKVLISAILSLLIVITSTVCYTYSIGINFFIDTVAMVGLFVGGILTFITLLWLFLLFIYFLVKRRVSKAFWCFPVCLILLLSAGLIMPAMGVLPKSYLREECAKHLQSIGQAVKECAINNGGKLPSVEWCDILIMDFKLEPRYLCCRGSYHNYLEGDSSYALNLSIVDQNYLSLPPDTVVIFETDEVGDLNKKISSSKRKSGDFLYSTKEVRIGAWNQVGGNSIVSCSRHAGLGCNILFADGHVEFIRKKELSALRWKP